jgi:uncharacterized membrane protein (DUF106 family)
MNVQKLSHFVLFGILFSLICSFSVVPPVEKKQTKQTKKEIRLEQKKQRLEARLSHTKNLKKQQRIKTKLGKLDNSDKTKNIFAILGFSLAIVSLVLIFLWSIPSLFFVGLAFSISGLVLSILGLKAPRKGFGIAGIVVSSLSLLLGLLFLALFAAVLLLFI